MRHAAFALAALAATSTAWAQNAPADPSRMSRAALAAEVSASREVQRRGGVTLPRPEGCTSAESRQLDFWRGDWDISPTGQTMVIGEAIISPLDQGCSTLEDFHLFNGREGHGLFGYDARRHQWRQSYIDVTGTYSTGEGGMENDAMMFNFVEPPPPRGFGPGRVHIQPVDSNTVRLWAEHENLATQTWEPLFDLTYHRRPGTR